MEEVVFYCPGTPPAATTTRVVMALCVARVAQPEEETCRFEVCGRSLFPVDLCIERGAAGCQVPVWSFPIFIQIDFFPPQLLSQGSG